MESSHWGSVAKSLSRASPGATLPTPWAAAATAAGTHLSCSGRSRRLPPLCAQSASCAATRRASAAVRDGGAGGAHGGAAGPGGALRAAALGRRWVGAAQPSRSPSRGGFCSESPPPPPPSARCWGLRGAGGPWGYPGGERWGNVGVSQCGFFGADSGVPSAPHGSGGFGGACGTPAPPLPTHPGAVPCGDPKAAVGRGVWGGGAIGRDGERRGRERMGAHGAAGSGCERRWAEMGDARGCPSCGGGGPWGSRALLG